MKLLTVQDINALATIETIRAELGRNEFTVDSIDSPLELMFAQKCDIVITTKASIDKATQARPPESDEPATPVILIDQHPAQFNKTYAMGKKYRFLGAIKPNQCVSGLIGRRKIPSALIQVLNTFKQNHTKIAEFTPELFLSLLSNAETNRPKTPGGMPEFLQIKRVGL